jgi:carboxyl-terminal processing protease
VTPHLAAPATIVERRAGRDPALDAAIAALAVEQARATEATPGL